MAVEVLDVTALVEREGFDCPECKHRHSGKTLAYICVGCPCDFVPDWDAIQRGLEDVAAGRTRPFSEIRKDLKY